MADSGINNISSSENATETENTTTERTKTDNAATIERKTTDPNSAFAAAERKRKNSSDSRKLRSAKSAQFSSAIKKGIKMGTTGFQQATQSKKKANTGLSQKYPFRVLPKTFNLIFIRFYLGR